VLKLDAVYVVVVSPEISLKVLLSEDDCHWIFPVLPFKVRTVLLLPEQTVTLPPLIVPETALGLTVIDTLADVAGAQTPLETTAR